MRSTPAKLAVAATVWIAIIGSGLAALYAYETTPGPQGDLSPVWPTHSRLRAEPNRFNLILFVHPRCPCTRASLDDLARIVEMSREPLTAHVVFFRPSKPTAPWRATEMQQRAASISKVRVWDDADGAEAHRFGAQTSGHAMLYDPAGKLVYTGGLTPARGRVSDNVVRSSVARILSGERAAGVCAPVYGCAIFNRPTPAEGK